MESGAGSDVATLQAENARLTQELADANAAEKAEDAAEAGSAGAGEPPAKVVAPLDALAEAVKANPEGSIIDHLVTLSEQGVVVPVSQQNIEAVVGSLAVVTADLIGKVNPS